MKNLTYMFLVLFLLGCAGTQPKRFSRDNYNAISGPYTHPNQNSLTQVKGLPPTPYESVCRQEVSRENIWGLWTSDRTSSSMFLDGGVLLTAAHNFGDSILAFSKATEFHLECRTGYAAAEDEVLIYDHPQSTKNGTEFIHPRYNFTLAGLTKPFHNDAALIKLCPYSTPFKSSFRLATSIELEEFKADIGNSIKPVIYVAGYPAHNKAGFDGSRLMHVKTQAEALTKEGVVKYKFRGTYPGMSGGPVWIDIDGEFIVIGVHVTKGGAFLLDNVIIDKYHELRSQSCD